MVTQDLNERFSRQVILPSVGVAGQKKWETSTVLLAGEGPAFQAAQKALETVGLSKIIAVQSPLSQFPLFSLALVITEKPDLRRAMSRQLRAESRPALFAWPSGKGYSLFLTKHTNGACPCLECFEVMNPKAFAQGTPTVQRILGAMAVSEALQWVLNEQSPLEGQVWLNSLEEGTSFRHKVLPSPKCPAQLLDEGAAVTP